MTSDAHQVPVTSLRGLYLALVSAGGNKRAATKVRAHRERKGEQWMKVVGHKRVTIHARKVTVSFCGASGFKNFFSQ